MCIRWLFSTLPHIPCSTARGWLPRYSTRGKTIVHVEGSFFNHCPLVFGSRKASLSFEATPRRVITLHPLEFRERSCKAGLSKSNACGSDPPYTQRRNHLQLRRSKRVHLDWERHGHRYAMRMSWGCFRTKTRYLSRVCIRVGHLIHTWGSMRCMVMVRE